MGSTSVRVEKLSESCQLHNPDPPAKLRIRVAHLDKSKNSFPASPRQLSNLVAQNAEFHVVLRNTGGIMEGLSYAQASGTVLRAGCARLQKGGKIDAPIATPVHQPVLLRAEPAKFPISPVYPHRATKCAHLLQLPRFFAQQALPPSPLSLRRSVASSLPPQDSGLCTQDSSLYPPPPAHRILRFSATQGE